MKAKYLQLATLAAQAALRLSDQKHYQVGAAAIRGDGTFVTSSNGPAPHPEPSVHAEARLCRKLDRGAVVFVMRIKRDGTLGMARPCYNCALELVRTGAKKVFYSTDTTIERLW